MCLNVCSLLTKRTLKASFELKSRRYIEHKDFSALRAFKKDYPMARCYLIYAGDHLQSQEKTIDRIAEWAKHYRIWITGSLLTPHVSGKPQIYIFPSTLISALQYAFTQRSSS